MKKLYGVDTGELKTVLKEIHRNIEDVLFLLSSSTLDQSEKNDIMDALRCITEDADCMLEPLYRSACDARAEKEEAS